MCGLTGFFDPDSAVPRAGHRDLLRDMANTLSHRGPDDAGEWAKDGVGLAHRRLSIVDLSPHGHQPMLSRSGRFALVYNGEIYNAEALRQDLEGPWRGHSDTEVLVEAIEAWGVEAAVKRAVGMFAFAVWDSREKQLHLVRDRLGIKPLYYGWMNGVFLFGSELKALKAHPSFAGQIDRDSLALQMRHHYVPTPWSIYKGVYKLVPGCTLTVGGPRSADFSPLPAELGGRAAHRPRMWWNPAAIYRDAEPFEGSEDEAQQAIEDTLSLAVRERMIADVPLGAFLSGGIDSTSVVALMQANASAPVRTYSIGFRDDFMNEAQYAAAVAAHLGTDHTELYVSPQDALDLVPELPDIYDEPYSDSSQIPTTLLCRMTRKHVTVALSGDGGDEVFAGYNRYDAAPAIWRRTGRLPWRVRRALGATLRRVPIPWWDRAHRATRRWLPERFARNPPAVFAYKVGAALSARDPDAMYHSLTSSWRVPVVLGARPHATVMSDPRRRLDHPDFVRRMMYGDLTGYLPDDILVKVDRASMCTSLEARVPLIDHRVVELAARMPIRYLIRGDRTKLPLRRLLDKHVPRGLIERPKKGFGPPLGAWLRTDLRDWAEAQLDPTRLRNEGWLDVDRVRRRWSQHLSGRYDWRVQLWDVLMFQAWLERQ